MSRTLLAVVAALGLGTLASAWLVPAWNDGRANKDLGRRLSERAPLPSATSPCVASAGERPLVLLALGQSNAGNHGEKDGRDTPWVRVVTESGCVDARDPLPGATGRGGSIWSRLPEYLVRAGVSRPVWLSLLAVESTSTDDWTREGSPLRAELGHLASALVRAGLAPDLVLWQQGEADAQQGVSTEQYASRMQRLASHLRSTGIEAPVVLARSTVCRSKPSEPLQLAIESLTRTDHRFVSGPDTDSLGGPFYRENGCHLSVAGLDAAAAQWAHSIATLVTATPN